MGTTRNDANREATAGRQPSYGELLAENRQLRAENEQIRDENRRLKSQVQDLTRQADALTRQVGELSQRLERLQREGKRQAAPFRKQEQPAKKPKKPGRKRGRRHGPHAHRSVPPRIDETYDVPLPEECPHCGSGQVRETHVAPQYQTEIPRKVIYRRFDVHVGVCEHCRHRVQSRHALQTCSARGAAASQLGPGVHAALAIMNKQLGLSHGKCVKLLGTLFDGLSIARGTSARSIARMGRRCQNAYEHLRQDVRGSPQVVADETGWRVGGRSAWLHAFVGQQATCYVIDPTRSGDPAERLLGRDFSGALVHDGWSVYERFTRAAHQQCLAHLQRRCEQLLETARGGAARLPRAVLHVIDSAYALRRAWRGHRLNGDALAECGLSLSYQLEKLASGRYGYEPNRRLAGHLLKHAMHWFWFLIDPKIDATNYRGEQAIRPAVVNRKVWGGNRTWPGAHWQSILTSVIRTCEQRAVSSYEFLIHALCSPKQLLLPATR